MGAEVAMQSLHHSSLKIVTCTETLFAPCFEVLLAPSSGLKASSPNTWAESEEAPWIAKSTI
eukprot:CAMPEP_0194769298 /NCGR_PEP_ID=MMETSP0323_2-20130528/42548_1 /TAXON_ID=2866 ORGANISM="Crypthecodinium cohnii, Strain Seligo" /NCGR_SAMPLE_ID=MMETSP0323_2 /ASSEMBLY_ACC=CAM_ASM_000346 /LENGTH=61 /DNA_ID=CAMNT_0039702177 /DNA_START=82 /DNA_END=267 /DNA_ORIENTATION=+